MENKTDEVWKINAKITLSPSAEPSLACANYKSNNNAKSTPHPQPKSTLIQI